jgi:Kef-type K+ transport system membrane component KefB/nucleotide-binding universal stress UspA family protein
LREKTDITGLTMRLLLIPVSDPVLIFTIIMFIVLLVPVLLRKTGIPAIVGLMIAGIIVGPHGLSLIADNEIIELFGKVGLLYILFLAGLEIDYSEFRKNRNKGISFGILTFLLPFGAGYLAANLILSLNPIQSVFTGLLLASNTLIAFPAISKMGIARSPAVSIAISGTLITDTLVLVILTVISVLIAGTGAGSIPYLLIATLTLFVLLIIFVVPWLSGWFFRTVTNDGDLQFLYTLTILFALSYTADVAGAEPIIGAFFAGLTLNRLIPANSALMNRIAFVGNTLFIPVFLISIGMLVNLRVLFTDFRIEFYAIILITLALAGKWLAAWITRLVFGQNRFEMNLIFGLTSARAAATLAVALIGYNYEILDSVILNAVIILIVVTSLFSSWFSEKAGRSFARNEPEMPAENRDSSEGRILVPVSNPENVERLIDLAILLRSPGNKESVYPLAIVKDDDEATKRIRYYKPILDKIIKHASASESSVHAITRIDINIPDAIVRTSKEMLISEVVMGWSERAPDLNRILGNVLDSVLKGADCATIVGHLPKPLNTTEKIIVSVPEYAEREPGFHKWLKLVTNLSTQMSCGLTYHVNADTTFAIQEAMITLKKSSPSSYKAPALPDELVRKSAFKGQALYVIISARPRSVSFNNNLRSLRYKLPRNSESENLLVIYPQQITNM